MKLFLSFLSAFCYWQSTNLCQADDIWHRFATSHHSNNFRLVTNQNTILPIQFSPKETNPFRAVPDCSKLCARNQTCKAFNFYETETSFVCEQQPDNLCSSQTKRALISHMGSSIWDKLSTEQRQSCFETRFGSTTAIACNHRRPECFGYWPNCANCLKTCKDCERKNNQQIYECTLWLYGDSATSVPIFATCRGAFTFLIKRNVDSTTGKVTGDYRLSFSDINRLYRLNVYARLEFWFITSDFSSFKQVSTPTRTSTTTLWVSNLREFSFEHLHSFLSRKILFVTFACSG